VETIERLDRENPGLLRKYVGLNASKNSALRSREFNKIKLYPNQVVGASGTVLTKELSPGIYYYSTFSSVRIPDAIRQYEQFFRQGGI